MTDLDEGKLDANVTQRNGFARERVAPVTQRTDMGHMHYIVL